MKVALGLYTTLYSAPSSLFEKTLSLVYEPVLASLYNKPGKHLYIYQSSQMMKYIQRERQEYKALIATLAKRGELEPITGSWSQALLSLLPPKDRVAQIEKLTSFIRHEYGVLPTTAFFYGQVWQPYYISPLKNGGIDNVVISTYKANSTSINEEPFVMNELGKREKIYPFSDYPSFLVESYSKSLISYQELREKLLSYIEKENRTMVIFLNIDQLVLGSQREGQLNKPGELIVEILSSVETVDLFSFPVTKSGYLSQGWYGRDSINYNISSFNELFVHNENYRYIYNRYIALAESTQTRNNRFLKRDVTTSLFNIANGNIFIHDAELSPLRFQTRLHFWRSIIDAENCFWEYTDGPSFREYDYEENGRNDIVMANKSYNVIISPKGASSPEFDSFSSRINYFDTRLPFSPNNIEYPLLKSFADTVRLGDEEWKTDDSFFYYEPIDKKRSEVLFTIEDENLPFSLSKRYKLRSTTFILDSTLTNKTEEKKNGSYSITVYLTFPDAYIMGPEQRLDIMAKGEVEAKTVKYNSKCGDTNITFTSTSSFTLREENIKEVAFTGAGEEEFVLYKKITFTFPLDWNEGESVTYRLVVRGSSFKKEDI